MKVFLRILNWGLFVASIVSFCVGFLDLFLSLSLKTSFVEWMQLSILSLTAFIALSVYINSKSIEEVNTLIRLRELLGCDANMKVHKILECKYKEDVSKKVNTSIIKDIVSVSDESKYIQRCDLYNYLGTLEMFDIIIENGIVSKNSFRSQFGYRLRNIAYCEEIASVIKNNQDDWKNIIRLFERFPMYYEQLMH